MSYRCATEAFVVQWVQKTEKVIWSRYTTGDFSMEALKTITAEDIKAVDMSDYL